MRTLMWSEDALLPMASFEDTNPDAIDSLYVEKLYTMVTGGDNGQITIWKPHRIDDEVLPDT